MQQLIQKLANGVLSAKPVPGPGLKRKTVRVRTHYSLISAGTESSTVKAARKGLLGKARERPQQVKQVLDVLRAQGPVQTYRAVMKKLDAYSPLGYSCSGQVIEVGKGVTEFRVGDFVGCGGLSACHAEIVSVPVNLCVKLPEGTDLKQAAYNTLGAIALQGVRQADLRLGESCAVIGLGLLGQLTCLLLRAAGVKVVGIDISDAMVRLAGNHCADLALRRDEPGIEDRISDFTGGLGCDAVIITAASSSLDPINFAGAIARKRATVVVVGAVPTGFDREPYYYRKELQLKMSCSYGPGRYDPMYEEKGVDYPPAYVRWTEKRNMQAFQELIAGGKVDVGYLTTHVFKLEEAPKAYDMMLAKAEPFVGILIEYDVEKPLEEGRGRVEITGTNHNPAGEKVGLAFIGAGSYAQSHLLPNLPKDPRLVRKGVLTVSGTGSRSVAERFGFEYCTSDERDIVGSEDVHAVFIATRHDSHADYVIKALRNGKHVFVEKPLALSPEELIGVHEAYQAATGPTGAPVLMVGYNRRFSPLAKEVKRIVAEGPVAMTYRVNAGAIPGDSWIQDPDIGGGRVIGEVCHFVDFLTFLNGRLPESVYATALEAPGALGDTLTATLTYPNGSVGTVSYFANGDKSLPKERLEVFSHGCSAVLDDFRRLEVYAKGKVSRKKLAAQDKGQKGEVRRFIDAVLTGGAAPIPFDELVSASVVTFAILESIRTGQPVRCG